MDPQATLQFAGQLLEDGDVEEAQATIQEYAAWARKGGFVHPEDALRYLDLKRKIEDAVSVEKRIREAAPA